MDVPLVLNNIRIRQGGSQGLKESPQRLVDRLTL